MAPRGGQDNAQGSVWDILLGSPRPEKNVWFFNASGQEGHFCKEGPKVKAKRCPKDIFAKDNGQGPTLEVKAWFLKHVAQMCHFSHHGPKGWAGQCSRECLGNLGGLPQTRGRIIDFWKPFVRECIFQEGPQGESPEIPKGPFCKKIII